MSCYKHGKSYDRVYNIWKGMLQRCYNINCVNYHRYGARGITVCEEWKDFEIFYKDMGDPPKDTLLERDDNNGPYCKSNCKWATREEQMRNTRSTTLPQELVDIARHMRSLFHDVSQRELARIIGKEFGVSEHTVRGYYIRHPVYRR